MSFICELLPVRSTVHSTTCAGRWLARHRSTEILILVEKGLLRSLFSDVTTLSLPSGTIISHLQKNITRVLIVSHLTTRLSRELKHVGRLSHKPKKTPPKTFNQSENFSCLVIHPFMNLEPAGNLRRYLLPSYDNDTQLLSYNTVLPSQLLGFPINRCKALMYFLRC